MEQVSCFDVGNFLEQVHQFWQVEKTVSSLNFRGILLVDIITNDWV